MRPFFSSNPFLLIHLPPLPSHETDARGLDYMHADGHADIGHHGIRSDNMGAWVSMAARVTAEDGATFWRKDVGVDVVRTSNRTLFRMLEWCGIEVE